MSSKNARRRARQAHAKTDRRTHARRPVDSLGAKPITPNDDDPMSWMIPQKLPWLHAS